MADLVLELAKVLAEAYSREMEKQTRDYQEPYRAVSWHELFFFDADREIWLAVAREAIRQLEKPHS